MPRMHAKYKKRPRFSEADDDSSSDEETELVTQEGNNVYFHSEVSRSTVLKLVQCLAKANVEAVRTCASVHEATVYLYIHSGGGDAYAGLSAFDHVRNNKVPVTTVVDGFVASAATFLLLGGTYRAAMKHSTVLIHQLKTSFWGRYVDLVDEMDNSKELMEMIKQVYAEHTTMSKKKIECLLCKEKNIDAAKCLSLGFVQELW